MVLSLSKGHFSWKFSVDVLFIILEGRLIPVIHER